MPRQNRGSSSHQQPQRPPRKPSNLPSHMRLIRIPTPIGNVSKRPPTPSHPHRPLKPQHPMQNLRPIPERPLTPPIQLPLPNPQASGHLPNRHPDHPPNRPDQRIRRTGKRGNQHPLRLGISRAISQPGSQHPSPTPKRIQRHPRVPQLGSRYPQRDIPGQKPNPHQRPRRNDRVLWPGIRPGDPQPPTLPMPDHVHTGVGNHQHPPGDLRRPSPHTVHPGPPDLPLVIPHRHSRTVARTIVTVVAGCPSPGSLLDGDTPRPAT